ncbi:MAG: DNA (cytosine-5)-methyltransferase 1, partial [Candidatus Promineifilaceae bacterium]
MAGFTLQEVSQLANRPLKMVQRWELGQSEASPTVIKILHLSAAHVAKTSSAPEPAFTFIDLFAGIGGIRRGFEAAGGQCLFTSEWNPFARQTYAANFACNHPFPGDITKVDVKDVPAHDVLVGGFPCQPFSIAGVSKKNALGRPHGFSDETQGTLFFDVSRIIAHHRPAAFMLENVKNLESHDKGNTFRVIRQ